MLRKGVLSFDEKVVAAYLHYVQGVDQHVIATAMCVNQGRVSEACMVIKKALNHEQEKADIETEVEGSYPPRAVHTGFSDR